MLKELFLLRGLPGSGKSSVAKSLVENSNIRSNFFEADSYFMVTKDHQTGKIIDRHQPDGEYEFDATKLHDAHSECQTNVEWSMQFNFKRIIVSNTFTTDKELKPYYELAAKYGYIVYSLIVENRHGKSEDTNIHNVPIESIQKMKTRFSVKL